MVSSNAFIITEMEKQAEKRGVQDVAKNLIRMGFNDEQIVVMNIQKVELS